LAIRFESFVELNYSLGYVSIDIASTADVDHGPDFRFEQFHRYLLEIIYWPDAMHQTPPRTFGNPP
jgi:hypothetical protein